MIYFVYKPGRGIQNDTLPDNFEVLENKVYFGSAQEIGTGAQPTGGQALPLQEKKTK